MFQTETLSLPRRALFAVITFCMFVGVLMFFFPRGPLDEELSILILMTGYLAMIPYNMREKPRWPIVRVFWPWAAVLVFGSVWAVKAAAVLRIIDAGQ